MVSMGLSDNDIRDQGREINPDTRTYYQDTISSRLEATTEIRSEQSTVLYSSVKSKNTHLCLQTNGFATRRGPTTLVLMEDMA